MLREKTATRHQVVSHPTARLRVADPLAPVGLLAVLLFVSLVWKPIWPAWITLGAIAGYSLSGST